VNGARHGVGDGDEILYPGQRYPHLSKVAVAMRHEGASDDEILDRLRDINAKRCRPMKTDADLADIVDGVGERHARGVKQVMIRLGPTESYVFRMDATAEQLADLVADDPDLKPALEDLARRAQAGEDVVKLYHALGDELSRRRAQREAEAAARREQSPEAVADREHAEKCERAYWQGIRESEQRRRETAKGRALSVLEKLMVWRSDYYRRYHKRWGWCGRVGDAAFVRRDNPHKCFCCGMNCKKTALCDRCHASARTRQTLRAVLGPLASTPPVVEVKPVLPQRDAHGNVVTDADGDHVMTPAEFGRRQINVLDPEFPPRLFAEEAWRADKVWGLATIKADHRAAWKSLARARKAIVDDFVGPPCPFDKPH
jgi:hypothetical protein